MQMGIGIASYKSYSVSCNIVKSSSTLYIVVQSHTPVLYIAITISTCTTATVIGAKHVCEQEEHNQP